jgi:hypothetical protein
MEGYSEENVVQNRRRSSDEDCIVFKKPARKTVGSNDDSDAKEDLNCVKMLTDVVPKRDEFSLYGEHTGSKL